MWQAWWVVAAVLAPTGAYDPSAELNNSAQYPPTYPPITTSPTAPPAPMRCDEARTKCALRKGCGGALRHYLMSCTDLISGSVEECDQYCTTALIALTSTEDGSALMNCECTDEHCRVSKRRLEVCRPEVEAANRDLSVLSCSVAHWICSADTRCSAAITFYDRLCRRMFIGKGCSPRCNNSITVLQRQPKAAKLETCVCDGTEDFDCAGIKANMARLCFHQFDEEQLEREEEQTNEVDTTSVSKARLNSSSVSRGAGLVCSVLAAAVVRWAR